jgi:hypothetical protein
VIQRLSNGACRATREKRDPGDSRRRISRAGRGRREHLCEDRGGSAQLECDHTDCLQRILSHVSPFRVDKPKLKEERTCSAGVPLTLCDSCQQLCPELRHQVLNVGCKLAEFDRAVLIEPQKGDKRYVRRDDKGHFNKEVNVGRSLAADRRTHARKAVASSSKNRDFPCNRFLSRS